MKVEESRRKFEKSQEYSGSPLPFVFFLFIAVVSAILAVLLVPSPAAALSLFIAVVSAVLLPTTVAINKEWEEAIILRFGKFQRLVGPGLFSSGRFLRVF